MWPWTSTLLAVLAPSVALWALRRIQKRLQTGKRIADATLEAVIDWSPEKRKEELLFQLSLVRSGQMSPAQLEDSPFRRMLDAIVTGEQRILEAEARVGSSDRGEGGERQFLWASTLEEIVGKHEPDFHMPESEKERGNRRNEWEAGAVVPTFLMAELLGQNCRNSRLVVSHPETFEVSGDWLICPNPSKFDHLKFPNDLKKVKDDPRGFSLIAYWIHPALQKLSPHFERKDGGGEEPPLPPPPPPPVVRRTSTRLRSASGDTSAARYVSDLVEGGGRYLYDATDLQPSDLDDLRALRTAALGHMKRVYGVEHAADDVDMFFHVHMTRNSGFRTAHLHISHRRVRSPECYSKSYALSAVIDELDKSGRVSVIGNSLQAFRPNVSDGKGALSMEEVLTAEACSAVDRCRQHMEKNEVLTSSSRSRSSSRS
jgi:hypothetical protein